MDRTEKPTRYLDNDQRVAVQTQVSGGVETDDRYFVFGNYIDEVLVMHDGAGDLYYAHDHLSSPVALLDDAGAVLERYERACPEHSRGNAYGSVQILTSAFYPLASSQYGNPYTFTGRELDTMDNNTLHLMYYRARTYDPQMGRFMQRDPLGINPAGGSQNEFSAQKQYTDGTNLYEHVRSNPVIYNDSDGLKSSKSKTCEKITKEFERKKKEKFIELGLGAGIDALPVSRSMPHQHCMWNCRMTWRKGISYAKKKSALKEELDNIYADYAVEMYNAGCWSSLPKGDQKDICHGARSADQPSDDSDNWTGMVCGLQDKCPNRESMEAACLRCCTERGVGPRTPDGPPDRDWGPRKGDIQGPCSEYLGPHRGSGGSSW